MSRVKALSIFLVLVNISGCSGKAESGDSAIDTVSTDTTDTSNSTTNNTVGQCHWGDDDLTFENSLNSLSGLDRTGHVESTTTDGFSDSYLYDDSGYIKVGVRQEWGGSLIFFGLADGSAGMNSSNTIDSNDTGREVQVAFYDPDRIAQGCAHDASCQTQPSECPSSISYLGWNPVQGGNRCNNGSNNTVVTTETALSITAEPLQWNPNWDATDCTNSGCDDPNLAYRTAGVRVTQTLRFVRAHVVELSYKIEELDGLNHASTNQELPTLYASNGQAGPDLWRLFNGDGVEVAIDTPAGNADGFYYKNFQSSEPWATLQDANATYGVALLYENGTTNFQGWQERSLPFNNFRALFPFPIPPHSTINARAYLVLGGLTTVESETQWLQDNLGPFGSLDSGNSRYNGANVVVEGWVLDNEQVSVVEAVIDRDSTHQLQYGDDRPDVCIAWPGYPNCDTIGFSGAVPIPQSRTGESCHLVEVFATDSDGNREQIGESIYFAQ